MRAMVPPMTEPAGWLQPPRPPSREDWQRLRRTRGTLLRELMNIEIASLDLDGRVIDVGGGADASYNPLLPGGLEIVSVNIDPAIHPTVLHDVANPLPFDDDSFDHAITFNTLEHLADDQFALNELVRVTKPGGGIHVLVPFLYRVHGHPDDYHRHTASGWNLMFRRAGIPDDHQQVRPLVWDPFSTGWAIADGAPLGRNWWRMRRFLRPLVLRRPLLMRSVDRRMNADKVDDTVSQYALAFRIDATKP